MQRSLFSGVSGMRNHQTKMDVIGNNISNVNTTAFKGGRARFEDILSQTIRGASGPQEGRGGINPAQVGLGMNLAAIDNNHTQGSLQSTGRETDLAIEGRGFFLVNDGQQNFYTRDGAFSLSPDGYLVNSASGNYLQGFQMENGEISDELGNLRIPVGGDRVAGATENVNLQGNLNAIVENDTEFPINVNFYDSLGRGHEATINFEKTGSNTWTWEFSSDSDYIDEITNDTGTIEFLSTGSIDPDSIGDDPISVSFNDDDALEMEITLDFSSITQYEGPTDVAATYQDGYPSGVLDSFTIGSDGTINGVYSNGMVQTLGQVALAGFTNPEGLSKAAGNLYQVSANSGQPQVGVPGDQGLGDIQASTLEMSNVDLVAEFTEMITTSRAFQANSRIISTSDEMLTEVVNLKR